MYAKPIAAALLLAAPLLAAPLLTRGLPDSAASAARADFDRVKALAGDWVRVDAEGNAAGTSDWSFRVTAGGHAVLETLFAGSEEEMITLYYMEGDELVLTHYCVAGNQPHMHAVPAEEGTLAFECSSDDGLSTPDEAHMHRGAMRILGPDELETEWRMFSGGENTYTASFRLRRAEPSVR